MNDEIILEHNYCDICMKPFINKKQWNGEKLLNFYIYSLSIPF